MSGVRLSPRQLDMLHTIVATVDREEFDGFAPAGAGQFALIRSLERKGMVEFHSTGRCEGYDEDRNMWVPTNAGRAAARRKP